MYDQEKFYVVTVALACERRRISGCRLSPLWLPSHMSVNYKTQLRNRCFRSVVPKNGAICQNTPYCFSSSTLKIRAKLDFIYSKHSITLSLKPLTFYISAITFVYPASYDPLKPLNLVCKLGCDRCIFKWIKGKKRKIYLKMIFSSKNLQKDRLKRRDRIDRKDRLKIA